MFHAFARCARRSGLLSIALGAALGAVMSGPARAQNEVKLHASDGQAGDDWAERVGISGDIVVVGSRDRAEGAAYICERDLGGLNNWGQRAKVTSSDGVLGGQFGRAVAVSGDTLIVGQSFGGQPGIGRAYIFERDHGGLDNWGQARKILAPDPSTFDLGNFAWSVDISGDTAIAGAYQIDGQASDSGRAYIFQRDWGGIGNWGLVKSLDASDGDAGDALGWSVSIDGDLAVVSAIDDEGGGSAYVFGRDEGNTDNWGQMTKLTPFGGEAGDDFGRQVSISGDTIIVGAPGDDDMAADAGAAYIFQQDPNDPLTWDLVKKLIATDGNVADSFGMSVSISGDTAVVGVPFGDEGFSSTGSMYVFERNAGGPDNWGQFSKIISSDADGGDSLGRWVDLDGLSLIAGAPGDDDLGGSAGAAYVFEPVGPTDTDGDGLDDADELLIGTDPNDPDTDDDGLLDGTEVDVAMGTGCPDPTEADSDGDTLIDGVEVDLCTDPCNADTDGDGLADNVDPDPLVPQADPGVIEQELRDLCAYIDGLDLSAFEGPNDNARKARANATCNKLNAAANAVAAGDYQTAADQLASLAVKLDGDPQPPDWMVEGTVEKDFVRDTVEVLAILISTLE